MNERIKELAEQSGFLYHISVGLVAGPEASPHKFAELIVRECAELVKDFYQVDEFTCYSAKTEIKEHFGVEL
jgi:hypothetical protein